MDVNQKVSTMEMKAKLSTLWIFVLLNMIFRDIHEFARPGFLEEIMAMTTNGNHISEQLLLLAGIVLQIPIGMVLLSRLLKVRANRWANIIAGTITIVLVLVNNTAPDLDDIFFATVEVIALLLIIWYAWQWPKQGATLVEITTRNVSQTDFRQTLPLGETHENSG